MTKLRTRMPLLLVLLALPLAGCQSFSGEFEASPAVQSFSDAAGADTTIGKDQYRQGNFGLAEVAYRKAVERDPADAEAWLGLGATHDQLRRFDLADREYAQVERLSGRTAALLNNRGYSHLLRGNFAAAKKEFTAALALDPGNPDIEVNLAAARSGRRP
jgi:Flp pilus assembly protein TadD